MKGRRFCIITALVLPLFTLQAQGFIALTWLEEPINMQAWPGPKTADLDLNFDGFIDFVLFTENLIFEIIPQSDNAVLAWPYPPPDAGSLVLRLEEGQSIGETPPSGSEWWVDRSAFSAWNNLGGIGYWIPPDVTGYFGVQFQIDDGTHYGWVYLDNSWGSAGGGEIYGWAYETTPYMPITAGAVPEPTTISLFCMGSLLLLIRRNKDANKGLHTTAHKVR